MKKRYDIYYTMNPEIRVEDMLPREADGYDMYANKPCCRVHDEDGDHIEQVHDYKNDKADHRAINANSKAGYINGGGQSNDFRNGSMTMSAVYSED